MKALHSKLISLLPHQFRPRVLLLLLTPIHPTLILALISYFFSSPFMGLLGNGVVAGSVGRSDELHKDAAGEGGEDEAEEKLPRRSFRE